MGAVKKGCLGSLRPNMAIVCVYKELCRGIEPGTDDARWYPLCVRRSGLFSHELRHSAQGRVLRPQKFL